MLCRAHTSVRIVPRTATGAARLWTIATASRLTTMTEGEEEL
jgi:hypothetical protein